MADVFGTLPVDVAMILTVSRFTPNASATTCATYIEPLPHFGAAMAEMDRPILIDMHQSAGLVVPVAVREMRI